MAQDITPQILKEKKATKGNGVMEILDVRRPEEFDHNHIPGAINIPFDAAFAEQAKKVLKASPDLFVVVYSEHEDMGVASKASQALEDAGFENVHHLVGGLLGWIEAGGTIEFGGSS